MLGSTQSKYEIQPSGINAHKIDTISHKSDDLGHGIFILESNFVIAIDFRGSGDQHRAISCSLHVIAASTLPHLRIHKFENSYSLVFNKNSLGS